MFRFGLCLGVQRLGFGANSRSDVFVQQILKLASEATQHYLCNDQHRRSKLDIFYFDGCTASICAINFSSVANPFVEREQSLNTQQKMFFFPRLLVASRG